MEVTMQLPRFLLSVRERCNQHLEKILPPAGERPEVIHEAMRYSVFAGGKRFRPALVMGAGQVFGAPEGSLYDLACGVELIHTYSLIHDDLPCMDDDDLRRGKPTLHRVYGDAVAVLAGDALYALAFEVIARCGSPGVIAEVARSTGTRGMIGGQVADILLEGEEITPEDLEYIHSHKTGRLITGCLVAGAVLGDARDEELEKVRSFGWRVGLAFQIVDDVLDETGDAETLGKNPGSDKDRDKNTYPKIHGLPASVEKAVRLVEEAKNALVLPERDTIILRMLADFVVQRVT
ncbi:MAG: polyprenyl synthetase family protein [bacterium]